MRAFLNPWGTHFAGKPAARLARSMTDESPAPLIGRPFACPNNVSPFVGHAFIERIRFECNGITSSSPVFSGLTRMAPLRDQIVASQQRHLRDVRCTAADQKPVARGYRFAIPPHISRSRHWWAILAR
jgi:hypothetical protein